MLFSDLTNISQGGVATHLMYNGISNNEFSAKLLINISVQEFGKSVSIWQSYGQYARNIALCIAASRAKNVN